MKKILIGGSIILLMLVALPVLADFSNGNFEGGVDPVSFSTIYPGQNNISNWTVDSGSVDYIGTYWQGAGGSGRSIDMNGNEQGSISQKIATKIGSTYNVTFYMSGNPDNVRDTKTMSVVATESDAKTYSFNTITKENTHADMKWEKMTYTFKAKAVETTITFSSTMSGAWGPALDSVSVALIDTDSDGVPDENDCRIDDANIKVLKNTKACYLLNKGVMGKGILHAPGLQKPFNKPEKHLKEKDKNEGEKNGNAFGHTKNEPKNKN